MRVHANQINAYAQMDALRAAEKAEAKKEAARTRKKLSEFASKLAGEAEFSEDCIVKLGAREESQEQEQDGKRGEKGEGDSAKKSISDWA
jgi:hypothetical protein